MRAYAVELFFDQETEEQLFGIWRGLAEAGINASMISLDGGHPHISLGVFSEEIDVESLKERLAEFLKGRGALDLRMESVGTFPTSGTVFISPTVTQSLLQLHKEFHAAFADWEEYKSPYYLPERWVPHCTVGIRLSAEEALRVIEYGYEHFGSGFYGRIAEVALVEIKRTPDMQVTSTQTIFSMKLA